MLLLKCLSFSLILKGSPIVNMVNALEGWDDFLVMGHDYDGGLILAGHLIEDTHHRQRQGDAAKVGITSGVNIFWLGMGRWGSRP